LETIPPKIKEKISSAIHVRGTWLLLKSWLKIW